MLCQHNCFQNVRVRVPADSSCRFMRSFCLIAEASGPRAQSPEAVESIGEGSASSTHLTVQTVGAALFVCFRTESDSCASVARLGAYKIRLINATRFSVQGSLNMDCMARCEGRVDHSEFGLLQIVYQE